MKFPKITRSDLAGNYIVPPEQIEEVIGMELGNINDMEVGESFTITVVEMSPAEFKELPEFEGW